MKNSRNRFMEYDEEKVRQVLPEGYMPLPSLAIPMKWQTKPTMIRIHGFHTRADAMKAIGEYKEIINSDKYLVDLNPMNGEITILAPMEILGMSGVGKISSWERVIKSDVNLPHVYRFVGNKKYVDALFEKGELMLSSFARCRNLENNERKDNKESRNIVRLVEGDLVLEADIEFDNGQLLMCTTLSVDGGSSSDTDETGFEIVDIGGFIKTVTKALEEKGVYVSDVLHGPCFYNDKVITIQTANMVSYFMSCENQGHLPLSDFSEYIMKSTKNDIYFNKLVSFACENEYRIIWELVSPMEQDRILIYEPEIARYCRRIGC